MIEEVYEDGARLDPSEYTIVSMGSLLMVNVHRPVTGHITFRMSTTGPWAYGDLLDFSVVGSKPNEGVVMYLGPESDNTSWVIDLMKGYPFRAVNMELRPIGPPSSLAPSLAGST